MISKRLAKASSKKHTETKPRWTEIEILQVAGKVVNSVGKLLPPNHYYIVREIGRSSMPGEEDRVRETECRTGEQVMAALTVGTSGKLSRTALYAVREAAKADREFAALIAPVLPEDLTSISYAPRNARRNGSAGAVITLEYNTLTGTQKTLASGAYRPLRFQGVELGYGTSRIDGVRAWTEIYIYRTIDGRYVAVKERHRPPEEMTREIAVTRTGAEIVQGFTRPGRGWVESALLDALDSARSKDVNLDEEIGREKTSENWAHTIVGSTEVLSFDARYTVLDFLKDGGLLFTLDSDSGPSIVGFLAGPNHANDREPPINERLFMALSRQSLIWRDYDAERSSAYTRLAPEKWMPIRNAGRIANLAAWKISPKGTEVLDRARARAVEPCTK